MAIATVVTRPLLVVNVVLSLLLFGSFKHVGIALATSIAAWINVVMLAVFLARRGHLTASHIHITQHLALAGSRPTELAARAGVSKQAMGKLVDQCEAWGLVRRQNDPRDARAWLVLFTPTGLAWLQAFEDAVAQAQAELHAAVGDNVATVIALGLEAYAA